MISASIPHDNSAQFSAMLRELNSLHISHNDLKLGGFGVDSRGRWHYPSLELIMFDFNMATINGTYSCHDEYGAVALGHPRYHRPRSDASARAALDNLWKRKHGE